MNMGEGPLGVTSPLYCEIIGLERLLYGHWVLWMSICWPHVFYDGWEGVNPHRYTSFWGKTVFWTNIKQVHSQMLIGLRPWVKKSYWKASLTVNHQLMHEYQSFKVENFCSAFICINLLLLKNSFMQYLQSSRMILLKKIYRNRTSAASSLC